MGDLGRSTAVGFELKPSAAEMLAAERVIHSIMNGMKNYAVFPADHASTDILIQGVLQGIARFNDEFGELGFEVTQKQIFYGDKPVYSGEASVDNPSYVLYRDGIRWFAFTQGVNEEEISVFFKMFNYYRVIPDEPEDDLVTALWRADLPHIVYEASYELWDSEVRSDLSMFKPTSPAPSPGLEATPTEICNWEGVLRSFSDDQPTSIILTQDDQALWELTPAEKLYILRLIREEAEYDSSEAAVSLMFCVLKTEDEAQVYESILNYLKEEFRSALLGRNFKRSYTILENVCKIGESSALTKPWTIPIHNRFQDDITQSSTLQPLISLWPVLSTLPAVEVKNFVGVLQQLPTKAGLTLATMMGQVKSSHARSLITEIIASYATRDQMVLEILLGGEDEDLALRMLRVVKDLPDREGAMRLLGRVMNNASQTVRVAAGRITGWQNLY